MKISLQRNTILTGPKSLTKTEKMFVYISKTNLSRAPTDATEPALEDAPARGEPFELLGEYVIPPPRGIVKRLSRLAGGWYLLPVFTVNTNEFRSFVV